MNCSTPRMPYALPLVVVIASSTMHTLVVVVIARISSMRKSSYVCIYYLVHTVISIVYSRWSTRNNITSTMDTTSV